MNIAETRLVLEEKYINFLCIDAPEELINADDPRDEIEKLRDDFEFMHTFIQPNISQEAFYTIENYQIYQLELEAIINILSDLHDSSVEVDKNTSFYKFLNDWSKIAKAPYPLFYNENTDKYEKIGSDDSYNDIYNGLFYLKNLIDYSVSVAKDNGIEIDLNKFIDSFNYNNLKDLNEMTNRFLSELTNLKEYGFSFKLEEIESQLLNNKSLNTQYFSLIYDENKEMEFFKYGFNHISDVSEISNLLSNHIKEIDTIIKIKDNIDKKLDKVINMIAEYNDDNDKPYEKYKFVDFAYIDEDKYFDAFDNNIISKVKPYPIEYKSLKAFTDTVNQYDKFVDDIENDFEDYMVKADMGLEQEAYENAYDMEM